MREANMWVWFSDRRNIVVIADEAHRSQDDFIDGFAGHMRDAQKRGQELGADR